MAITAFSDISGLVHDYPVHGSGSAGNGVALLEDVAGTDDVAQATGAKQPIYREDANGWGYLEFQDEVEMWLQGTFGSVVAQPDTVILIGTSAVGQDELILDGAAATNRQILTANGSALALNALSATRASSWGAVTERSVIACEFNGASSLIVVNGTDSSVGGNPGTSGLGGLTLGARYTGSNHGQAVTAYRVLIYSKILSDTEMADLVDFATALYGSPPAGGGSFQAAWVADINRLVA